MRRGSQRVFLIVAVVFVFTTLIPGADAADTAALVCGGPTPGAHDHATVRVYGAADARSRFSASHSVTCTDTWSGWPALNASYDHTQVSQARVSVSLSHGAADCTGPTDWATASVNVTLGRPAPLTNELHVKATGIATITPDLQTGDATLHFVGVDQRSTTSSPKTGVGGTLELYAMVNLLAPCAADRSPIAVQLTNVVLGVTEMT